jgi:hypothetical protein
MQTIQQGKVLIESNKTLCCFVNDSKDSRNQFQIIINFLLIHFFSTTRIIPEYTPNLTSVSIPVF